MPLIDDMKDKQRMIQEYVPGKQVTLAHVIANPEDSLYKQLGLDEETPQALGIMTITPGEAVIIAADVMTKAADITLGFLDRFGGSLVVQGDVSSVESALREVVEFMADTMRFSVTELTRS